MIQSLYSGATGMEAQQLNLNTIANNLANANTTGFKRSKSSSKISYTKSLEPSVPRQAAEMSFRLESKWEVAVAWFRRQRFSPRGR